MPIVHDPKTGKFSSSGVMGKSAARSTRTKAFEMVKSRVKAQVFGSAEAAGVAAKRFKGAVESAGERHFVKFGSTGYLG